MRRFWEQFAIIATIDPVDANNNDGYTDEIDMSKWDEVAFICMLGVINGSATFDFKLQEATTSGGSFSDISGKSITQLTGAGSDGAKQAMIGLLPEELSHGYRYVKGKMDNSAHSQLAAIIVLGRARYQPASDDDLASVDEIVT